MWHSWKGLERSLVLLILLYFGYFCCQNSDNLVQRNTIQIRFVVCFAANANTFYFPRKYTYIVIILQCNIKSVAVSAELTCSVSFLCSRFTQLCSFTPTQFHGTAGQIKYIDKTSMVQFNEGQISRLSVINIYTQFNVRKLSTYYPHRGLFNWSFVAKIVITWSDVQSDQTKFSVIESPI
jgi:hypothetical protein